MENETRPRNVAVLVVHGVADQEPAQSAREIAAMLSDLNTSETHAYSTFVEDDLQIDVEAPACAKEGTSTTFSKRIDELRNQYGQATKEKRSVYAMAADSPRKHPGIVLMHEQLLGYAPTRSERVYRTVELTATRTQDEETRVHVYEMYWADLSRLSGGVFRIFGELYQLLLHVPSLGRHTVDAASAVDALNNPWWSRLRVCQTWAAWLLTVPIPLLNLWMLGCFLVGLSGTAVSMLSPELRPVPGVLILLLAALAATALKLVPATWLPFGLWVVPPFLLLVGAGFFYVRVGVAYNYHLVAIEAIVLMVAVGFTMLRQYERTRPDSKRFGRISLVLTAIGLAVSLAFVPADNRPVSEIRPDDVLTAALRVVEIVYIFAMTAFVAFFIVQRLAAFCGRRALRYAKRKGGTADSDGSSPASADVIARLTRAERTARITLAIPAVSFIVVTMVLWAGLYAALRTMVEQAPYPSLWLWWLASPESLQCPYCLWLFPTYLKSHSDAAWQLLAITTLGLIALLALTGLAILCTLWAALPPVVAEVRPSRDDGRNPAFLGNWLDRGFRYIWFAGWFIRCASALVVPLVALQIAWRLGLLPLPNVLGDPAGTSEAVLKALGSLVAGTALGLLAFKGRLSRVTGGLRPVLDVLLDVDNYLREHPQKNNPRAAIVARYVAMLRHLCNWRDASGPEGRPFDALVIIAHSQGAVISADLLRFLQCYEDKTLACLKTLPVHFFTMGCPLRQLYGLRFPHLYDWAYHLDSDRMSCLHPPPDGQVRLPLPDPIPLGVTSWVNVYRSADYIGRHLWHVNECKDVFTPRFPDATVRGEACIGEGAHTHYWDGSAPAVTHVLDQLIVLN